MDQTHKKNLLDVNRTYTLSITLPFLDSAVYVIPNCDHECDIFFNISNISSIPVPKPHSTYPSSTFVIIDCIILDTRSHGRGSSTVESEPK